MEKYEVHEESGYFAVNGERLFTIDKPSTAIVDKCRISIYGKELAEHICKLLNESEEK